ncbi:putative Zn-dependent peptidase [Rhodobium orientis]|uniref:Peptidase M16 n=1 Tax=Rhodobium orientis TaxID=34017 RepID=A0A327JRN7_9HYPH|nr:pitrilysin family protein [Rhodobium orientis]MBB4304229.1 putative Zn-dependent peptidase [Rhodobium orientis]MBK5950698.1 peptidase M16 [Rhodobium orientis]RAI28073.1 peptidase M16 [Rhodobium orientis]
MSVRITPLDSGLTVISHNMRQLESAALGVWVGAGSRSETAELNGISHLLEHMAFKGTKRRSARQIAEEIEAVGGELNASTSVENTSFYARILEPDLDLALDILSDILVAPAFDPEELRREQHVILQEIGAANDTPDDYVFDLFQEAAWPNQPMGRPILGTKDTVRGFGPGDLRNYLSTHYRAPATVLAAAGSLDHDKLVRLAEERFTALSTKDAPAMEPGRYVGGEMRERRKLMETQIVLGFEGMSVISPDYFGAQLLAGLLGGGMSSRLFQEVREHRGLCYSIYAFHWAFSDTGLFGIHAATGEDDIAQLMPVMLDELERVVDDAAEEELARARAQMRASLLMAMESPAARANQLARQMLIFGRPLTTEEIVERIETVSAADIRRIAATVFSGSRPTLATVGPDAGIPGIDDIASRFAGPTSLAVGA